MNDIVENVSFPQNWNVLKMRQCFSFGKGLSITKDDLVEEGIPVISYGQVHAKENTGTGLSDELYRYVPESFLKTGKSCLVQKNDFIFADTSEDYAGVGNCAFIDNNETIFAGYHSIIARPTSSALYPKYLAYLFLTDLWRDQIRANVMGIKVFSITQQLLRDTYICVPPISEQKCIVELLDESCTKLDIIIANLKQQIELLQKYKKSLITETVTKGLDRNVEMKNSGIPWIGEVPAHWEIKQIKYFSDLITKGATPDDISFEQDDLHPVRFLKAENIQNGKLYQEPEFFITKSDFVTLQRASLIDNDILFVIAGATIGKVAIMREELCPCTLNQAVCLIRMKQEQDSDYFTYVLQSNITSVVINLLTVKAAQPNLSMGNISNIKLPVPSKQEQSLIAEYLNSECFKIDKVLSQKENQLKIMKQHKASLIFEYVTGKKRVKEFV